MVQLAFRPYPQLKSVYHSPCYDRGAEKKGYINDNEMAYVCESCVLPSTLHSIVLRPLGTTKSFMMIVHKVCLVQWNGHSTEL
jgi:hypothetical protein